MNIVNVVYLGRPSWGGGKNREGEEREEREGEERRGRRERTERERVLNNLYCQSVQGLEF